ncbi:MAG TPA: DUF6770 family protein [Bacteroidia bacterium]
MKFRLFILSGILLSLTFRNASSQNTDFKGIKEISRNNVAAMMQNNEVIGYYILFFSDQLSDTENEYDLEILDNNLKVTHSSKIKISRSARLREAAFNGEGFCFCFVDILNKNIEYKLFDVNGLAKQSYTISEHTGNEAASTASQSSQVDYSGSSSGLYAVPGKCFIRYGMKTSNGFRIFIEAFNNNGNKMWLTNSGTTTKKSYESLTPFFTDEKISLQASTFEAACLTEVVICWP